MTVASTVREGALKNTKILQNLGWLQSEASAQIPIKPHIKKGGLLMLTVYGTGNKLELIAN